MAQYASKCNIYFKMWGVKIGRRIAVVGNPLPGIWNRPNCILQTFF